VVSPRPDSDLVTELGEVVSYRCQGLPEVVVLDGALKVSQNGWYTGDRHRLSLGSS
jgi:hypothetical protein